MPTLYRRDEEVTDPMGNPVSGVQIALATQPANTSSFPPTPAVQLYLDAAGNYPLSLHPQTDQDGHASYYVAQPGIYTCVYYSTQIATPTQTIVMPDQIIAPSSTEPQYNSDTTATGSILPSTRMDTGYRVYALRHSGPGLSDSHAQWIGCSRVRPGCRFLWAYDRNFRNCPTGWRRHHGHLSGSVVVTYVNLLSLRSLGYTTHSGTPLLAPRSMSLSTELWGNHRQRNLHTADTSGSALR